MKPNAKAQTSATYSSGATTDAGAWRTDFKKTKLPGTPQDGDLDQQERFLQSWRTPRKSCSCARNHQEEAIVGEHLDNRLFTASNPSGQHDPNAPQNGREKNQRSGPGRCEPVEIGGEDGADKRQQHCAPTGQSDAFAQHRAGQQHDHNRRGEPQRRQLSQREGACCAEIAKPSRERDSASYPQERQGWGRADMPQQRPTAGGKAAGDEDCSTNEQDLPDWYGADQPLYRRVLQGKKGIGGESETHSKSYAVRPTNRRH